jgi:hypothetical protein
MRETIYAYKFTGKSPEYRGSFRRGRCGLIHVNTRLLRKHGMKMWIVFIWLRTVSIRGELLNIIA